VRYKPRLMRVGGVHVSVDPLYLRISLESNVSPYLRIPPLSLISSANFFLLPVTGLSLSEKMPQALKRTHEVIDVDADDEQTRYGVTLCMYVGR
jgi:hypothetical protein